jgi:hypothetical protein
MIILIPVLKLGNNVGYCPFGSTVKNCRGRKGND